MKKIAVVGAGFSGMAVCWHLRKFFFNSQIDLFDKNPIGENTSSMSTGLLHGFVGKNANKSLYADEAISCALTLLQAAQKNVRKKIYFQNGLFKVALSEDQKINFSNLDQIHHELEYINAEKTKKIFSNLIDHSGIFIKNAVTVNSFEYLQALFLELKKNKVSFFQKKVSVEDLEAYDVKIYCTGHNLDFLKHLIPFKYEKIKGQMLVCHWPDDLPKFKLSVCGNGHITIFDRICYLGATYEHNFENDKTDEKVFNIIDKIKTFFPSVEKLKIIDSKAGIRVKRKGHYFPYIEKFNNNNWVFSCLGSRGLLYHSYLAKKLASAIKSDDIIHIPKECLAPNS